MDCKLSSLSIKTFCHDVLPLTLLSDDDIRKADIKWSCDSDCILIRDFANTEEYSFNNGILITFLKPGKTKITAELENKKYVCDIEITKPKIYPSDKKPNFYIGDLHDHTSNDHKHDSFATRETELPIDYINQVKKENKIDFSVITDHADVLNQKDFYRGFTDTEKCQPMELIMYPGSESEVTVIETDRYGLTHKNAGEIVYINSSTFKPAMSWEEFYEQLKLSPFGILILAHPQVIGWDKNGIWNFSLHKNNFPLFKELVRGVEIGNGEIRGTNAIHELYYSVALDNGFKVSPTCSSDSHGPVWGYNAHPGKTIIMAHEKSKEAFTDALLNRKFYACESGNVKLYYTINGQEATSTLSICEKYKFHIECDYFNIDPSTVPYKCQVISDGGNVIKEITDTDFSNFDFELTVAKASYFYLRLVDKEGRKTISAPIWTTEKSTPTTPPSLKPLSKDRITVTDINDGTDASILVCDDPEKIWTSNFETTSLIIDLGKETKVSGLGHYPARYLIKVLMAADISIPSKIAELPVDFSISASSDGKTFIHLKSGKFRIFGGEEVIEFNETTARFIKLDILSSAGKFSEQKEYLHSKISISELTVYTK